MGQDAVGPPDRIPLVRIGEAQVDPGPHGGGKGFCEVTSAGVPCPTALHVFNGLCSAIECTGTRAHIGSGVCLGLFKLSRTSLLPDAEGKAILPGVSKLLHSNPARIRLSKCLGLFRLVWPFLLVHGLRVTAVLVLAYLFFPAMGECVYLLQLTHTGLRMPYEVRDRWNIGPRHGQAEVPSQFAEVFIRSPISHHLKR
jgi:hypothetical protein